MPLKDLHHNGRHESAGILQGLTRYPHLSLLDGPPNIGGPFRGSRISREVVFHNLADSPLYGQEAEMCLAQVLALMQVRRKVEGAIVLGEVAVAHEKWSRMYERSKRRRKLQERMSLLAFALFAAGYSQILYVVICWHEELGNEDRKEGSLSSGSNLANNS